MSHIQNMFVFRFQSISNFGFFRLVVLSLVSGNGESSVFGDDTDLVFVSRVNPL